MPRRSRYLISRRDTLAGLAATAVCGSAGGSVAAAQQASDPTGPLDAAGPVFVSGGPKAAYFGANAGYPVPDRTQGQREGNPWRPEHRVGAFTHLDEIYPTRTIRRAAVPWTFKRTAADIRYRFEGRPSSLADYLSRNAVTGLLVARDDEILFEHYQYARTDRDRFVSQSMVKSIMGILVGIAIADGAIKSVDDTADVYVPGFKGSE